MSAELDIVKAQVTGLSVTDLLALLEHVTEELRHKVTPNGNGHTTPAVSLSEPDQSSLSEEVWQRLGVIKYPKENTREILSTILAKEEMEEMFTLEELDGVVPLEIGELPTLPKSLAELISEDREDRV